MLYEIKEMFTEKNGKKAVRGFITEGFEMASKDGLNAVKFIQQGKSRFTWLLIPNDYQMEKYFESYSIVICEATTGRRIHSIDK